jgi:hypothetical protein
MIFSNEEREQFQNILPAQGNLKTLELVDSILKKVSEGEGKEIEFSNLEISLLTISISTLDRQCSICLSSLPLIKKLMEAYNNAKTGF